MKALAFVYKSASCTSPMNLNRSEPNQSIGPVADWPDAVRCSQCASPTHLLANALCSIIEIVKRAISRTPQRFIDSSPISVSADRPHLFFLRLAALRSSSGSIFFLVCSECLAGCLASKFHTHRSTSSATVLIAVRGCLF